MRPLYPGQLHQVRKNIHHVVFALDFSKKEDLTRLLEEIVMLIKRQVPIRFGIVGIAPENDPTAAAILQAFYHLVDSYGRAPAMQFIENLLEQYDESSLTAKAKALYTAIYTKAPVLLDGKNMAWDEVVAGQDVLENVRAWTRRLGVNVKDGAIFGNGQVFIKDDTWVQKMGQSLNSDVQILQRAVYAADIGDDDDILEFLFRDSPKTRNEYIFPVQNGNVRFLNLVETVPEEGVVYLAGQKDAAGNTSVIWIVDDFDSFHGSELVRQAAAFQAESPGTTLGFVHNPGSTTGPPTLSLLVYYLSSNGLLDGDTGRDVFEQLLRELEISKGDTSGIEKILGVKAESWRSVDSVLADKFWERGRAFAQSAGFAAGERGVVMNGRVCEILRLGAESRLLDRSRRAMVLGRLILRLCRSMKGPKGLILLSMRQLPLGSCLDIRSTSIASSHVLTFSDVSVVVAKLTSIASVSSTSDVPPGIFDTPVYSRRRSYELLDPTVGVLEYGSQDDAVFQFAITLDPLSEAAQKWSFIIKVRYLLRMLC
jgi:UDP-glucose:glycoprotein glucosyltransferase